MPASREFAEHVRDLLAPLGPVWVRGMFGGFGVYLDGRMFGLIADDVLYLRTDDGNRDNYLARGMAPFTPFPGRAKPMPYHEVPGEIMDEPDQLCAWAREAVAAAMRAPSQKRREKK